MMVKRTEVRAVRRGWNPPGQGEGTSMVSRWVRVGGAVETAYLSSFALEVLKNSEPESESEDQG